jgi:hypothetical protein
VRLTSSNDPEGHVGGTVATGKVFHATEFKGDDSEKLAHQFGILAWGLKFHTLKFLTVETLLTIEVGLKHLRRRPSKNKVLRKFEVDELYKLEAKFAGSGPIESNVRRVQDA